MEYQRDVSRYVSEQIPLLRHESMDSFLGSVAGTGLHQISYGHGNLDLLLEAAGSRTLIVLFHAAAGLDHTYPIFTGRKVAKETGASRLYISDPSLELGVRIGWFGGDQERRLQHDLPEVIRHVSSSVAAERIIFFGPSAGGFASLFYSHLFTDSLCITANPQTAISRYYPHLAETYLTKAWSDPAQRSELMQDLIPLYQDKFTNYVVYLQNSQDTFHLERHFKPWRSATSQHEGKRWLAISEHWGDGHAPPPAFYLEAILQFAVEYDGQWSELIQQLRDEI